MDKKNSIYWVKIYWLGTMTQMLVTCFIVFLLKSFEIPYPEFLNLLFLAVGGTSSALWGTIVAKKSQKINSYKEILLDFFGIKQPMKYYVIVFLFIVILFGRTIFTGNVLEGVKWNMFLTCFITAIVFGGIEEIGWRYTFQPLLEKKMSYEVASVLTFLSWGLWHYMYFYMTDSSSGIQHVSFLFELIVNCFVLGAIYRVTHSLWLCVLYHCLVNTFSQTLEPNDVVWGAISNVVCILLAIIVVRKHVYKESKH